MKYFLSDLHLFHTNILKYCHRPFLTVQDMNECIFSNINTTVDLNDKLYILGDFVFPSSPKLIKECRAKINCSNVYLILGNHDKAIKHNKNLHSLFAQVYELGTIVKYSRYSLTLCHYPLESWFGCRNQYGLHLHGHQHGNGRKVPKRLDVGWDCYHFPLSCDKIMKEIENK